MSVTTRRLALAGAGLMFAAVLGACVGGVGYSGDVGVGYSPGYIEPFGYDYGGWGGGYRVGPGRGGDHRAAPSASHSYRSAPQSRSVPSIPHGSGGSRGTHR
ncbi:MAG: hypothetical protein ACLQJ0_17250 [Steroidobacteraceae bacterium]|jgi:hypothetical protein